MKKKLVALITALTLCATVVVGTTLAYFSQQTDEVKNTFSYTPGTDPAPEIIEPSWPENPTITPNKPIPKDPQITLTAPQVDGNFFAAMVIKGTTSTSINQLKTLAGILAEGSTTETITVPALDKNGNPAFDANNTPITKEVTITKDNGIAKIADWSNQYDFEIDADGTLYAYYKNMLNKDNRTTAAIFQQVVMNKDIKHFYDQITGDQSAPLFDITVQGYVVAEINDSTATAAPFADVQTAMSTAFPTIFTDTLTDLPDVTAKYPDAGVR